MDRQSCRVSSRSTRLPFLRSSRSHTSTVGAQGLLHPQGGMPQKRAQCQAPLSSFGFLEHAQIRIEAEPPVTGVARDLTKHARLDEAVDQ